MQYSNVFFYFQHKSNKLDRFRFNLLSLPFLVDGSVHSRSKLGAGGSRCSVAGCC